MAAKWLDVVRKAAPALAGLVGGPGGMALKMLSQAFLGSTDGTEEQIGQAVLNDPDAVVKLRQLELELDRQRAEAKQKILELGVQLEKIDADDRASARAREIALKDWTTRTLAIGIFALFVATTLWPYFDPNVRALQQPDLLKTSLALVLGYYFGSSAGSMTKTMLSGGTK